MKQLDLIDDDKLLIQKLKRITALDGFEEKDLIELLQVSSLKNFNSELGRLPASQ